MALFGRGNGVIEKNPRPIDLDAIDYAQPEERALRAHMQRVTDEVNERAESSARAVVDLARMGRDTTIDPITEIKRLTRCLTFGEMTEMCKQISAHMPKVDMQDTKELLVAKLPQTMHDWATDAIVEDEEPAL